VEQYGDVAIAVQDARFLMKGGDIATCVAARYQNVTYNEGLFWGNNKRHAVPNIAHTWKVSPDQTSIEFWLRDDVKFHNGDPVTAEDVIFSIKTYKRKELKFLYGGMFRRRFPGDGEIIDPYHIRLPLDGAVQGVFLRLWNAAVLPKKYREKVGDDGFAKKPIGAGNFKWVDYEQDQWYLLEAVKDHHRKIPEIKTLKFVFVPEPSTRLAMLRAGEVDIAHLSPPHVPLVKADPNLRVDYSRAIQGTVLAYADLAFPKEPSPFHDIRVRKAASLAIDRAAICEKVLFGLSELWGDTISPITLGADPTIKPDPYDPEQAKKLLAEAGYPNGFETTMNVTSSVIWAQAAASYLTDIGIRTKLKMYETGAWVKAFRAKKFRGLIPTASWAGAEKEGPADMWVLNGKAARWSFYVPDEGDRAIKEGMKAITDEEIEAAGRKMSKILRSSRYKMYLWSTNAAWGIGPKIKVFEPQPGYQFTNNYDYITVHRKK
jgi:peptide/nickel transport system substrate-binding protein